MNSAEAIKAKGKALMLSNRTMDIYAKKATPRQAEFLIGMFDCELAYREENKRLRLTKRAAFPVPKHFEGYDWSGVQLPQSLCKDDLVGCAFVARAENMVCYGPVGTGKTHLATAVGLAACEKGMKVRFTTTSELVLRLLEAKDNGTLGKLLSDYASNDLTILDEFGYVPIDREGSRLLFQVVSRCYESKSLLLTTNLEFSRWGTVLTEEQMASAMADRLLHHGHVVTFKGDSYRMRNALMGQARKAGGRDV